MRSRSERAYAVTYGKITRIWRMLLPIRKRVRIFTKEERKRWSAALPIPKNYTASVIAVCGGSKVAEQCLLTAAVQNMKKIAMCCGDTHSFFLAFFPFLPKKQSLSLA